MADMRAITIACCAECNGPVQVPLRKLGRTPTYCGDFCRKRAAARRCKERYQSLRDHGICPYCKGSGRVNPSAT
jgi:hypothetical protein